MITCGVGTLVITGVVVVVVVVVVVAAIVVGSDGVTLSMVSIEA